MYLKMDMEKLYIKKGEHLCQEEQRKIEELKKKLIY